MTTAFKIQTKPVDHTNQDDLEALFESKGGPKYCWCMPYRAMPLKGRSSNAAKKSALLERVEQDIPIGLLAYVAGTPVAWCSIAPRETYTGLGGDTALKKVWSLACFFIKREYRRQGMMTALITAACKYAKKHGAKYVEAYPVDTDSPSYRFMGFKPVFEQMNFELKGMEGSRRHVMLRKL
ncbi:MAG TPA: GNAT family N-acetyltransferase [Chitinophaga sp.]